MSKAQLRIGRTYTDGKSAVRTVEKITTSRDGVLDQLTVIYREVAGRNRGMVHTMPMPLFLQFAVKLVRPKELEDACRALGLNAWPMDSETHGLIMRALQTGGIVPYTDEHRSRLERLAGHKLATRIGTRSRAEGYEVRSDLLNAAGHAVDRRATLRLAA